MHGSKGTLILLVYVDDVIVTGSSTTLVQDFIDRMSQEFNTKDVGSLHYFLGLEVHRSSTTLLVSQKKYASELLHRAGLEDCKPTSIPLPVRPAASEGGSPPFHDPTLFRSLVGGLQYLTTTRPDI